MDTFWSHSQSKEGHESDKKVRHNKDENMRAHQKYEARSGRITPGIKTNFTIQA
jgi:hypothetical protein